MPSYPLHSTMTPLKLSRDVVDVVVVNVLLMVKVLPDAAAAVVAVDVFHSEWLFLKD